MCCSNIGVIALVRIVHKFMSTGPYISYKLRHFVGFGLVDIATCARIRALGCSISTGGGGGRVSYPCALNMLNVPDNRHSVLSD